MNNKRKFTVRLNEEESLVVCNTENLQYVVSTFRELSKHNEEYEEGWNVMADIFQDWIDKTKFVYADE